MSRNYDNWERLVAATLRREQLWQVCHAPSISSRPSDFSLSSPLPDLPFNFSSPNLWYQHNTIPETGPHRWGYDADDFELLSEDKQLAPGDVIVNGKALNIRELNVLQSCSNPPGKLKPGSYWYDKFSGFWGKQGHKPSQIISANLDIGGYLQVNASNGNTLAYINGRELTKVELRLLKLAGVKCYRDMHLWLNEDGSYQEEAGNSVRSSIWNKAGMKLLCSLLSLPYPPKDSRTRGELSVPDYSEQSNIQKLLLLGCRGSGTSTIFKQAIFLYKDIPFLEDELEYIKLLIQSNIYGYICILLEGRKHFEEEDLGGSRNNQPDYEDELTDNGSIYSFGPRSKANSDWLLSIMASRSSDVLSASVIQSCAPLLEEVWRDTALQETFKRRSELGRLPSVANDFLERAVDFFKPDYEPSHMDILHAEGFPSSLSYVDFSFPSLHGYDGDDGDPQDYMMRYRLIRPTSEILGDYFDSFDLQDVRMIVFCIALSDYDQFVTDDDGASINKMMYNKNCFESMVKNPIFDQIQFLLLLTKSDLFEEKMERVPLNQCDWFHDFHPVPNTVNLGEKGSYYISVKFRRLYTALTGRKLYVAKVNCLEQLSVDAALRYAGEVLKWDEESSEYIFTDFSSEESFNSEYDS